MLPHTEWFVTLADDAASARLDAEVAVTSGLRTLRLLADDVTIAATTRIGFAPAIRRSPSDASAPAASSSAVSPTSRRCGATPRSIRS